MKRCHKVIVTVLLVGGLVAATAAVAHRGGGWRGGPAERIERMVDYASDRLQLDGAQSDKLAAMLSELNAMREQLRGERGDVRRQIIALLDNPALDQQQLIDMVTEKTRAVDQLAPRAAGLVADFVDSLDADQKREIRIRLEQRGRHRWD